MAASVRRMEMHQRQVEEIEQQVAHRYGGGRQPNRPADAGARTSDQVQIYLRDQAQSGRSMGGDHASQAVLTAELQTVRHLLAEASMTMSENASATMALEQDYESCMEELRTAKQSWQAADMSLKVQSETVERLNSQVSQLTEELRIARDTTGEWRTKAEDLHVKLERIMGGAGDGMSAPELQQELSRVEAKLSEANRLRLLDAQKLAKQQAALERMEELEQQLVNSERAIRDGRKETDEWRAKAEAYGAELLAWRSKSETWEASKAQSVRGLQQERDRLQAEWQMMRESLQSAEASLAVQTAAVQRLEGQVMDTQSQLREAQRKLDGWDEKEEDWKTEVLALRTRMEAEGANKDARIEKLQGEKEELERQIAELSMGLQSAEASLAVQTAAVQRVEKQAATLMVEVRQSRRSEEEWRVQGEEARAEVKALQVQLNSAVASKDQALRDLHELRERLEAKVAELTKAYSEADAQGRVYVEENKRIQKELDMLKEELRKANDWRMKAERLQSELSILQQVLNRSGAGTAADALKEIKEERNRLLLEVEKLRPQVREAEIELSSAKAKIEQLEAQLQQQRMLLGEAQGKAEKYRGEMEGFKAEVGSLRMQLEDCMARSEHAITTIREERDLLHSELERLRNALQAASGEISVGMQAVAKLSNVDARTVTSQVRVYGDGQTMQNHLHMQMDTFRRQLSSLRGGDTAQAAGGVFRAHGPAHDEFRPASGRARRVRGGRGAAQAGEGNPEASQGLGGTHGSRMAGAASSALMRSRGGGVPDGGAAGRDEYHGEQGLGEKTVHRPSSGKYAPPPSRFTHKDFTKYADLNLVFKALEWLSAHKGRPGTMPTDPDLRAAGMSGVADAIAKTHGGIESVAANLGLQMHHTMRPSSLGAFAMTDHSHWDKFNNIKQAALELADSLGAPDTMPTYTAFRHAGLGPVADAIRVKHGGITTVAERLGLQLSPAFAR